ILEIGCKDGYGIRQLLARVLRHACGLRQREFCLRPLGGEEGAMIEDVVRLRSKEASLEGGNDVGDGVVEGDFAVEIGLPVEGEELEVAVPAALIEALALGVGSVLGVLGVGSWIGSSVARSGRVGTIRHSAVARIRLGVEDRLDDFAGGVKN